MRKLGAGLVAIIAGHGVGLAAAPPPDPAATASPFMGLAIEAGALVGRPALLTNSQTVGGELAVGGGSGALSYGLAVSLSVADRDEREWRETHTELRGRARIGLRTAAGIGIWELRLGAGFSAVRVENTVHLTVDYLYEDELPRDRWFWVPGIELEGGLTLGLADRWGLALFLGPTFHFGAAERRDNVWGWRGSVGIVWAP